MGQLLLAEIMKKAPLTTSRSLPIALIRAREKIMGPIRLMLNNAGVTEQQWRVLRVLEESGPGVLSDVAAQACLLLPSMTRIVQTLHDKGLVTRAVSELDRRRQVIAITATGIELVRGNMDEAHRLTQQLEKAFGARKLGMLLDLLNEMDSLVLDD